MKAKYKITPRKAIIKEARESFYKELDKVELEFVNKIASLVREKRGKMTVYKLSLITNISETTIRRVEEGMVCNTGSAARLCGALGITIDAIDNKNRTEVIPSIALCNSSNSGVIPTVEFIYKNNIPFLEANVINLMCSHKRNGRAKDIEKAIGYCKLILENKYNKKL